LIEVVATGTLIQFFFFSDEQIKTFLCRWLK
jgi:hypothetical protein